LATATSLTSQAQVIAAFGRSKITGKCLRFDRLDGEPFRADKVDDAAASLVMAR
jgi:hypothetical protein